MRKPWGRRNSDSSSAQSPIDLATLPAGERLEFVSTKGSRFVVRTAGRFGSASGGGYRVEVLVAPIRYRGQVRMCVVSGAAKTRNAAAVYNAEKLTVSAGDVVWLIDLIGTDYAGVDPVRPFKVRTVSIGAVC